MVEYRLIIGLNDKDTKTQIIDTIEAVKIVQRLTIKYFGNGNISNSFGVYTHENGEIVIENSLTVSYIDFKGSLTQKAITDFILEIKLILNQESVLIQKIESTASFK